ncbi:3-methyl-2-oxobutanoate hydroxymethyltransferase [Thiomicrospira sp. WB1]|uniref:3-methyl-2-oxobutanoate hydroxymethyltransferase n=1 Tax=Thiomicrospira sp. WB1 TaxID=1685380 RepID=UPI00074A1BD6|nr:3-methyl-2-oxobutanoate hydroxymethyltransferase [Thiomicrospira sp. WB1]KUJ71912.1 3-methyl-2-oxobutanoate hydroxymethyltransferase [Thiomicrospira sp. WB1]
MIRLKDLHERKASGEKLVCLTAYDATQAHWAAESGVDILLVGDSLGMVVQGHDSTLPVTMDEMVYHTKLVQRGNGRAWCMADMPFLSDASLEDGVRNAGRLLKEGGANMVKLEGRSDFHRQLVQTLSERGMPVCAHLGLLPQSVQKQGYRMVGKAASEADQLLIDARHFEAAGADMLLLECVARPVAQRIAGTLSIPVIGIGCGPDTDAQVLVWHDVMGTTVGGAPSFSHDFLAETGTVQGALKAYVEAVKTGQFPK